MPDRYDMTLNPGDPVMIDEDGPGATVIDDLGNGTYRVQLDRADVGSDAVELSEDLDGVDPDEPFTIDGTRLTFMGGFGIDGDDGRDEEP